VVHLPDPEHMPEALAEVHAALAYYFDHREEIQEEIRAERTQAEWKPLSSLS
jgi:hypothetical protein